MAGRNPSARAPRGGSAGGRRGVGLPRPDGLHHLAHSSPRAARGASSARRAGPSARPAQGELASRSSPPHALRVALLLWASIGALRVAPAALRNVLHGASRVDKVASSLVSPGAGTARKSAAGLARAARASQRRRPLDVRPFGCPGRARAPRSPARASPRGTAAAACGHEKDKPPEVWDRKDARTARDRGAVLDVGLVLPPVGLQSRPPGTRTPAPSPRAEGQRRAADLQRSAALAGHGQARGRPARSRDVGGAAPGRPERGPRPRG
jgi:hypothetical protein